MALAFKHVWITAKIGNLSLHKDDANDNSVAILTSSFLHAHTLGPLHHGMTVSTHYRMKIRTWQARMCCEFFPLVQWSARNSQKLKQGFLFRAEFNIRRNSKQNSRTNTALSARLLFKMFPCSATELWGWKVMAQPCLCVPGLKQSFWQLAPHELRLDTWKLTAHAGVFERIYSM